MGGAAVLQIAKNSLSTYVYLRRPQRPSCYLASLASLSPGLKLLREFLTL